MRIEPKVEKPTRDMLGHAIRGEVDDLATLIHAVGGDIYRESIGMCLAVCAYISIDISGRWPTDADVHQIAHNTAENETRLNLPETDIRNYLSRAVLGFEPFDRALGAVEAAASLPVIVTGSMLFIFRPRGQDWWDYLDTIEAALEAAERTDLSVLPALTLRARRPPATLQE
jgi:hypothetical protein